MNEPNLLPGPSPAWPRRAAFVLAGGLLLVLHAVIARVRESGAVPAEEFGPAETLYSTLPFLLALGVGGAAAGLFSRSRRGLPLAVGSVLLVASAAWPLLLVPGLVVAGAGAIFLQASVRAGDAAAAAAIASRVSRPSAADALRTFLAAAAIGTLATAVLALLEATLRTSRFAPRVFPADLLPPLRLSLLAWAGVAGLLFGAIAAAAATALGFLLAAVRRGRPGDPALVPFAGALAAGAATGLIVWRLVRGAFGDEADALGLAGAAGGLAVLLGVAAHAHVWSRLARCGFCGPGGTAPGSAGAFAADLASLALLPPGPVPRSRTARAGLVLAVSLALLAVLATGLFPDVEDYREQGFSLYAATAFLVVVGLLLAILRTARPAWRPGSAALAIAALIPLAAIAAGAGPAARSDVRLVFHEYTRLGPLAADYLPKALFRPFPRLGEGEGPTGFPHDRPGEDGLPARPVALADRPTRPPILFVVWDAVRPDHLRAFGGGRAETPALDRLAAESVVFTGARATATATTSSVRAFLAGRYATRWMLTPEHPPFFLRELREAGYGRFLLTAMGNDYNGVSAASFTRGWEDAAARSEIRIVSITNRDDEATDPPKVEAVLATLTEWAAAGPEALDGTFTYLHLIGGHLPWESTKYGTAPADGYDGEIEKLDGLLARLLDGLDSAGALDRMAIVLLADHGTGLGEHGRVGGFLTYEEQIRVPLLFRIPGLAPRRVSDPVTLLDVAPTLVGLAAPGRENPYHGRSLMPLLAEEAERLPPRPSVALSAFNDAYSILDGDGRFKLWHHRGKGYEALYDLTADPGETRDVSAAHPERATELRGLLDAFLRAGRGTYANPWHYRAP